MTAQRKSAGRGTATSTQPPGTEKKPDPISKAHSRYGPLTVVRPAEITICYPQANADGEQQTVSFTLKPLSYAIIPGREQPLTVNPTRPNLTGPNDLLQISTGATGSPTVSARELYCFLQVKTEFAKWCKRMFEYGFTEGQDYVQVFANFGENSLNKDITLKKKKNIGGRPETDYALTLDCAKEIAMVQRTEQGRRARQYFIDCEKRLRAIAEQPTPAVPPTETTLLQLVQGQQDQINQLQQTLNAFLQQRPPVGAPTSYLEGVGLRQLIVRQIGAYAIRTNLTIRDAYTHIYQRLLAVYGVDVFALSKPLSGSFLDAIARAGHLERLYALILDEASQVEAY